MSNAKFLETDGKFLELRLANAASGTVSVDNVLFVTPINKKMAFAGGQLGTTAIEDIEVNYEEKEIFDLQGRMVSTMSVDVMEGEQVRLNTEMLNSGVYFVRVNNDGAVRTAKLVVK